MLRRLDVSLTLAGFVLALSTLVLALTYAPIIDSETMNAPSAQRIFYWHVPAAWASFLAYGALFIGSLAWFWKRSEWGWAWHRAGAEVSLLFSLMVVISGPIWGQAEWDRPWDWTDMRLNTYLVLTGLSAFIVLGFRTQPDGESARDTFSAFGLFGFILVPLTIVATTLWNRSHPEPIVNEPGGMPTEMAQVFWFGVFAFTVLSIGMLRIHIWLTNEETELEMRLGAIDEEVSE